MAPIQSWLPSLLASTAEGGEGGHGGGWTNPVFYTLLMVVLMMAWLWRARQGYTAKGMTNRWAGYLEQLYLFLEGFALGIIGPHGRKYMPMLATFWLFIFISCFVGLFTDYTPTADWSLNLGLAIVAVLYVQWEGMKANGIAGHFKHFAGPKMGGALVLVSGMIFIIEILSETMKMLSLSLRLYGNIHGGHEVVLNLNNLGNFAIGGTEVHLPVGGLLLPIKLLTCIVQPLVFTLLFSVYLGLVTHHEEDHEHHGEAHGMETAAAH